MTPREIAAWMSFAQPRIRAKEVMRFRLANIAAQGDGKAITKVVKALQGEDD